VSILNRVGCFFLCGFSSEVLPPLTPLLLVYSEKSSGNSVGFDLSPCGILLPFNLKGLSRLLTARDQLAVPFGRAFHYFLLYAAVLFLGFGRSTSPNPMRFTKSLANSPHGQFLRWGWTLLSSPISSEDSGDLPLFQWPRVDATAVFFEGRNASWFQSPTRFKQLLFS